MLTGLAFLTSLWVGAAGLARYLTLEERQEIMTESFDVSVELGSIDSRAFWLDVAERTGKTFLQNVALFFTVGATITTVSWPTLLQAAGLAALVSFLLAVSTATAITSGNFLVDLADRGARTFAGTLVGAIPATGGFTDVDWGAAFSLAATAALLSVITSLVSKNFGTVGLPTLVTLDR
ncbi:holin [Rhodococcus sp. NPDC055112]